MCAWHWSRGFSISPLIRPRLEEARRAVSKGEAGRAPKIRDANFWGCCSYFTPGPCAQWPGRKKCRLFGGQSGPSFRILFEEVPQRHDQLCSMSDPARRQRPRSWFGWRRSGAAASTNNSPSRQQLFRECARDHSDLILVEIAKADAIFQSPSLHAGRGNPSCMAPRLWNI